jgi:2-amino-4-hydroxy-6-hydroxymethyldihydropteridine diphosphokinase
LKRSRIYLGLGSNLGNRRKQLNLATEQVGKRVGRVAATSRLYDSDPWGYESGHRFMNCCLAVETGLDPLEVMDEILSIEGDLGRPARGDQNEKNPDQPARSTPGAAYEDRLIDIDLLLYEDLVMEHPRLTLPHPGMGERRFVLVPLSEIAADLVHPVFRITIREMLERCPDPAVVRPVS